MQSAYLSFEPVYYFSKCLGTIPLKFVKVPSFHFIQTWHCTVFSSVYVFLSFVHGIVTPYFVSGESKTSSTLVHVDFPGGNVSEYVSLIKNHTSFQMVAMRMLNPLMVSFMTLGAQFVSMVYVKNGLPHFFNKLSQVDISLSTVIMRRGRTDSKITFLVVLYFCVLSLPVSLFYLSYSFSAVLGWEFIWNLMLTLDNFISFSCEIQFIVLAFYLSVRFRIINNFLYEHIDQHISMNYFSIYICIYCWILILCSNLLPPKSQLTLKKIEILHFSNKMLCELMKDLNSIYKIQLLCTAAGCFIKVLFNIYYAMYAQWQSSVNYVVEVSKILLWTMYYLMRFLVTTITASLTSKEIIYYIRKTSIIAFLIEIFLIFVLGQSPAMKTKSLVAGINSRRISKEMQEELSYFLDYISSMEMKFTACGLLTVNTRLITAALATGTTYLVVLVQFRPQV